MIKGGLCLLIQGNSWSWLDVSVLFLALSVADALWRLRRVASVPLSTRILISVPAAVIAVSMLTAARGADPGPLRIFRLLLYGALSLIVIYAWWPLKKA